MLLKFRRGPLLGKILAVTALFSFSLFSIAESEGAVKKPAPGIWAKANAKAKSKSKSKIKLKAKQNKTSFDSVLLRNWGLENKEFPSHIEARKAWKLTKGSRKIVVAVIDTGIDPKHIDLKDNLWHKAGTDEYGFDFVSNQKNPGDENGHGSHIAGIIGATLKGHSGAAGVAPNVSIMPIRYYAEGASGSDIMSNIVKSIDYAVANGANIINFSGEGTGFNVAEYRAIERAEKKGILFVAAAGNQGQNSDATESPCYPGSYELPNIITVAATNIKNELLPVSNYGATRVHVAAPGENIFSTLHRGRYGYLTGTSQATAFVSGLAALMLSENPNLKPAELKKMIMNSVDPSPDLYNKVASGGRINAFKAVHLALDSNVNAPKRAVAAAAN